MKKYDLPLFDNIRDLHLNRYYKNYDPSMVAQLKNIHKDQQCFLVGTGPSMNLINHSLLKDEIVFGTNTLYKDRDINPTYYCVSDKGVWHDHKIPILHQDTQLLLSGHAGRDYLANRDKYQDMVAKEPIVFKDLGDIKRDGWIDKDMTKGAYWGNTIMVDLCLQIAYYMGFKEVYLLGCDCNYKGQHHFDGEVFSFQKDTPRYYEEHWEKVFEAHAIVKKEYEKDGRKIFNATPGGSLNVYDRVKLEDIV